MRRPAGAIRTWGTTESERAEHFACDDVIADPGDSLYRAVSVAAPPAIVFGWLCQLRIAPYSYDLLDNLGRRSPRTADSTLEALELGQRFMATFRLVAFEPGRSITLDARIKRMGRVVVTYRVTPVPDAGSRLVAKVVTDLTDGVVGRLMGLVLPLGDLLMMRKQLLTLRSLAERDAIADGDESSRVGRARRRARIVPSRRRKM